jgi:tRNA pseudouridine38-40 synthase
MGGNGGRFRYRLTLEFDGSNFSGWQKQADARTVQGDLLKAATRVFGVAPTDIQGCGRTDAGVHALAYTAHLEVTNRMPPLEVFRRLNDALPKDIAVRAAELAQPRFHARHSCIARSYFYRLRTEKSAFGKRYDWWVRQELDLAAMRQAAAAMVGMHDFASFADTPELKKSTRVFVNAIQIGVVGEVRVIRVVGSHFLWHMVRRMVGVLVEVGCHRLGEEDVRSLMQGPSEIPGMHTAPAAGLFFERAFYETGELERFVNRSLPATPPDGEPEEFQGNLPLSGQILPGEADQQC